MNERITILRKSLQLTMENFGSKLGVTRSAISNIESGKRNLTDQMIVSICREFHVNEEWLRTGIGEMFNPTPNSELEALAKKYNLSHDFYILLEKFLSLKEDQQTAVIDFMKSAVAAFSSEEAITTEEKIQQELDSYRLELELESRQMEKSSVLDTHVKTLKNA